MNILKQYRNSSGINQAEMAIYLNTSQSDISKIETDCRDMSIHQAILFIEICRIDGFQITLNDICSIDYQLVKSDV